MDLKNPRGATLWNLEDVRMVLQRLIDSFPPSRPVKVDVDRRSGNLQINVWDTVRYASFLVAGLEDGVTQDDIARLLETVNLTRPSV